MSVNVITCGSLDQFVDLINRLVTTTSLTFKADAVTLTVSLCANY